ncbi:MAG TPA: cupin domain-containing protein [Kofleriaceae bacterium]|nr:cupin domain-containing protein [Kofleriaceae bacterium]
MTTRSWIFSLGLACAALAGGAHLDRAAAQAPAAPATPGFKRTELQRHDLATAGREAVLARAEFAGGVATPKHTHPGEEVGVVIEGEVMFEIDGKPALKLKAGDSFFIPPNTPHLARNASKTAGAVVVSTYILEKGKPLATPVK